MLDSLDLVILDPKITGAPHVIALARRGSDVATAEIPCDQKLTSLLATRDQLEKIAKGEAVALDGPTLKKFGVDLKNYIFRGDLALLLSRASANRQVRLQVLANREEFHKLPWEYMQFDAPGTRPGPDNTRLMVRLPSASLGNSPPSPLKLDSAAGAKLRLLFVAADPSDQQVVHWDRWLVRIQSKLEATLGPANFRIRVIPGSSQADVQKALAAEPCDVFHFAGHGTVDAQGEGVLLFKSPSNRQGVPVRATDLAADLKGRGIRLAVLSACRSSDGSFSAEFRSTAVALLDAGIGAVVANQFSVPQETVDSFLDGLYTSLLAHGDIDIAVAEGRLRMRTAIAGDLGHFVWGIPTLYRLYDSSLLLEREAQP